MFSYLTLLRVIRSRALRTLLHTGLDTGVMVFALSPEAKELFDSNAIFCSNVKVTGDGKLVGSGTLDSACLKNR